MDLNELATYLQQQLDLQVGFTQVLVAFALLMARVLPVVILTPFLGGETVPSEVKLGLGVMLGLILYPAMVPQMKNVPVTALLFVAMMLKELFIGLCLSFVVGMVFEAVHSAGTLIDTLSGTNQAQLMVPSMKENASLFSNLNLQLSVVVFLTLNGHHLVFQAFGDSLQVIPLDQFPRMSGGSWPFFDTMIRIFGDLIRIAVAIASPVLLAAFLTDLALGMINRVASQIQVFFISQQIKPGVTVLIMVTATHLILQRELAEYREMFRWLQRVFRLLA